MLRGLFPFPHNLENLYHLYSVQSYGTGENFLDRENQIAFHLLCRLFFRRWVIAMHQHFFLILSLRWLTNYSSIDTIFHLYHGCLYNIRFFFRMNLIKVQQRSVQKGVSMYCNVLLLDFEPVFYIKKSTANVGHQYSRIHSDR